LVFDDDWENNGDLQPADKGEEKIVRKDIFMMTAIWSC
jgi:hypothetical protein